MGGLASICITGAEKVAIADAHVRLLFPVFIHITEHEVETAIVVWPPTLVRGLYVTALIISIGKNTL
jgi:hypothetical protein